MKRLLDFSQASTKLFVICCWFLLSPASLLTAQALTQEQIQQSEILLAQADTPDVDEQTASTEETELAEDTAATPSKTHSLEFNRTPLVSEKIRLRGISAEGSVGFTRPRSWDVNNVQALIRFRHSAALYANRSNLTVLVNDTAVGSVALDRKKSQTGQLLVNIPPKLLQDYNELKLVAQQRHAEVCVDPYDPSLWTEIQPDSKLVFNYKLKQPSENFSRYPYPIIDELDLKTNRINYLQPNQVDSQWLTGASRLQASLGRQVNFRSLEAQLVSDIANVKSEEKLVVIGTPKEQPALKELDLPIALQGNQIMGANGNPLPEDRGVLVLTATPNGAPVLVATGNGEKAVEKAVKFLVQPNVRKMATGSVVFVDKLPEISTPKERAWPRHLPEKNSFKLRDIKTVKAEKFTDVTVRGAGASPVVIDFRALPDDRFLRGSSMNLVYSYGPQLNPRTSVVEVLLDGNFIGGQRLSSESGETRKTLKVDLPPKLIKPNSKIEVFFRMNAREPFNNQECRFAPDDQLTATVHNDTNFNLKRETFATLPNLELLQFGYPFASPQDLSKTTIVVPQNPSKTDVLTLLEFSERLGQISEAASVRLNVHTPQTLSQAEEIRNNNHIVAIGTQNNFPLPKVLEKKRGLNLSQSFTRLFSNEQEQVAIQVPLDSQGMIKQVISPWNNNRVVLALTAQTESGLDRVRQLLDRDNLFFSLKQDTVLVSSEQKNPSPDDENAYDLDFFTSSDKTTSIDKSSPLNQISRLLQENWLLLPLGIVGIALLLYGTVQLYLKRVNPSDE